MMSEHHDYKEVFLCGYTDRLSGRPGRDRIRFHVSCTRPGNVVAAHLTRSICADPNPQGPGIQERDASRWFSPLEFSAARQSIQRGSFAVSQDPVLYPRSTKRLCVHIWMYSTSRTTFQSKRQCIWSWGDKENSVGIYLNPQRQLLVATSQSVLLTTEQTLSLRKWYRCSVVLDSDGNFCQLDVYNKKGKLQHKTEMKDATSGHFSLQGLKGHFYLAKGGSFNGKLESPRIATLNEDETLIAWDTSQNMTQWSIPATTTTESSILPATPLLLQNHPTRGVKGYAWDGSEFCWKHKPSHYGAIYFHDDDIFDFGWDPSFAWNIPKNMPSGIYIMHLCTKDEDADQEHIESLPLFICAPAIDQNDSSHTAGASQAKKDRPCVLISTFTYVMYGNHARSDFDEAAWNQRVLEWKGAYRHNPMQHPSYGWSTYNFHSDGSGIHFASHRRPLFNLRPGFLTFGHTSCSGLRHFPADSHLIAFLHHNDIDYDVVTDHELHQEGVSAISSYSTLITGSHPEYHSSETLYALQSFRDDLGGNLMYLGGDGFYWRITATAAVRTAGTTTAISSRTAVSSKETDTISLLEIRRAEDGVRTWAAEPGEYHHVLGDNPIAGYGGLWRRLDRPPQQLVGVGFTAQGSFTDSMPYERSCFDPEMSWVFEGLSSARIDDDGGENNRLLLGDFGFSGGGAAGFELDRVDRRLDGEDHKIWILAQAFDRDHRFMFVPEEVLTTYSNLSGLTEDEARRADMIYFRTESGSQVFSVGSITFCGSLPWNHFDNPIAILVLNVIRRFMETSEDEYCS